MCCMSGQSQLLSPSCLESDFLGVKSADKPVNASTESEGAPDVAAAVVWVLCTGEASGGASGLGFPHAVFGAGWRLVIRLFLDAG